MNRRGILPIFWLLLLPLLSPAQAPMPTPVLTYTLAMPEPKTHYFTVELHFENLPASALTQGRIELKMPVWTPGSYLVREYARNLEGFSAQVNGQPATAVKVRKNAWQIPARAGQHLRVRYRLYANELTVRTNYVGSDMGYANGAASFLYADALKNLPIRLEVLPAPGWNRVDVALPAAGPAAGGFAFTAAGFDELVDSPIQIGNHELIAFTTRTGIRHRVAMAGPHAEVAPERIQADFARVCEAAATVVGENPAQDYLFILHHLPGAGSGGLEHRNSASLQTSRQVYTDERAYRGLLGLVAHEYFHLWNIKRIRPTALGPFDYDNENYTHALWVAEGWTSMYDNHILRRAGLSDAATYLGEVAADFNYTVNTPGTRIQSLAEASYDAWIKYYRPNENSVNTQASYYVKGAAIATLLNLSILHFTNGQKSLDDVMGLLYERYYKQLQRGYTDAELQAAVEAVAGRSMEDFFSRYVWGTETPDFDTYLAYVGCRLTDANAGRNLAFIGAGFSKSGEKWVVSSLLRDSPAWNTDLSTGDELLAINGQPVGQEPGRLLEGLPAGQPLRLQLRQNGQLRELSLTPVLTPQKAYRIEQLAAASPRQVRLYKKWLWLED